MWFQRYRFNRHRQRLLQAPIPEMVTPRELNDHMGVIVNRPRRPYDPRRSMGVSLHVSHKNFMELDNNLTLALRWVKDIESVSGDAIPRRTTEGGLHIVSLDDFLINRKNHPLQYDWCVGQLHTVFSRLDQALEKVKEKDQHRHDYYLRQYTHLLHDCHRVVMGLLEVA